MEEKLVCVGPGEIMETTDRAWWVVLLDWHHPETGELHKSWWPKSRCAWGEKGCLHAPAWLLAKKGFKKAALPRVTAESAAPPLFDSGPGPLQPASAADATAPGSARASYVPRVAGPPALIRDLHRRGIALWVEEGRLGFQPASRVSAEERELLRAHQPELISLLQAGACLDS